MIDPEDLLMEHGLRELLGGDDEGGSDELPRRVREAWERGERRPALPVEAPAPRPLGVPANDVWWRRPRGVAAAAALVGLAGGVLLWATSGEAPEGGGRTGPGISVNGPPVARATRALRLPDGALTAELPVGVAAFVPAGDDITVELGSGLRATLRVASQVRVEPDDALALLAGGAEVEAEIEPADVRLARGVSLRVPARSRGSVELFEAVSPELGGGFVGAVRVRPAGAAWAVVLGNGIEEDLAAGEVATLLLSPAGARVAAASDLEIGEEIPYLGKPLAPREHLEVLERSYREGVLAALREAPELWVFAEQPMLALLEDNGVPAFARQRILLALGGDTSLAATEVVREIWRSAPELVPEPVVVALAERGVHEFVREVEVWLDVWEPGAGEPPFAIALHLGLQGDDRATALLRDAMEVLPDEGGGILAAAGLARIGDLVAWEDELARHAEKTRALIELGNLESAAMFVDALAYAAALKEGTAFEGSAIPSLRRAPLPSAPIEHWTNVHHMERLQTERSAQELEAELVALGAR